MAQILKYIILFYEMGKKYARGLITGSGIPTGGNSGQVLKKASNADYDTAWSDDDSITVDSALSDSSENPVQNKIIHAALALKANASSLANKLDKNQGAANKDKVLTVGADGTVTPQTPSGGAGIDLNITGATVGQFLKVASVDADGAPTSYDTEDLMFTLTVNAVTQDGVTVTGQTVTVSSVGGAVYATAAYEGQAVSFAVPVGFEYHVSITDTLAHHFNPTTASGMILDADVTVTLTYSDFSTIQSAADIKAALNAGLDLTDLVGEQITCTRGNATLTWDVADYDSVNHVVTILLHDTLPDQMVFEPAQALAYFDSGLAAGDYKFKQGNTYYYFTLQNAIPSGGQLKATGSTFQVYESREATATQETGTVSSDEIANATDLGTTGSGNLNHHDRVSYGSNNYAESGLRQWLNSNAAANTPMYRPCKFSRPYTVAQPGFLNGLDANFIAALDDTVWRCSANNVYECPDTLGGLTVKGNPYTVTDKIGLASQMEIFGSYDGVADGSSIFDLFVGASADDRKKYYNGSARFWWMRSPNPGTANGERYVGTNGNVYYSYATSSYGVVPACKISKSA